MTTTRTRATRRWPAPAALLALCAIPALAGIIRLGQLVIGVPVTAENARFFQSPAPIVLHIAGATTFVVLGAFQFVPSLRRRSWHRVSGRLLVPAGMVAAASALWMTVFYPKPPTDGPLLGVFRLVFGSLMFVALVLGYQAIRRKDVRTHRAWLTRAYALGVAAGTQAFLTAIYVGFAGEPGQTGKALLLAGGWVLNLAAAEVIIRRTVREKR
jgi:uncharacterized membrane protein